MSVTVALEMTGGGVRPARMYADRDIKMVLGRITMDSAYATGGEALSASDIELNELYNIQFSPAISGSGAVQRNAVAFSYDYDNKKIIAIEASSSKEYAETIPLGSYTTRFVAFGI